MERQRFLDQPTLSGLLPLKPGGSPRRRYAAILESSGGSSLKYLERRVTFIFLLLVASRASQSLANPPKLEATNRAKIGIQLL